MKKFVIFMFFIFSVCFSFSNSLDRLKEIAEVKPSKRQYEWQRLEVSAFFHFGINTFANLEWSDGSISPRKFNPKRLDCSQWVKSVKAAGCKLAILTVKHHDGFCLWPSKFTDYSVKSSPYKDGNGDVVREFVDACRQEGIKVGFYLSPWDRHEKSYGSPAYNDFFVAQIKELFENYGPIDEFWFDGACGEGKNGRKQIYDWARFYKTIRELNKDCVIAVNGPDVRWVGNESGLARESEWSVVPSDSFNQEAIESSFEDYHFENISPSDMKELDIKMPSIDNLSDNLGAFSTVVNAENLIWYPAECDVSIRPGWFYHWFQNGSVKSLKKLVDIYFKSVGRNSLLLLNVPPDKNGLLYKKDVERLKEFGDFIRSNFSNNLLDGAKKVVIVDKESKDFKRSFEFSLDKKISFNTLSISEDIRQGQRVENFSLYVFSDEKNGWENVVSSTTIGYKRLLKFDTVSSDRVLIVIEKSRWDAFIENVGLFLVDEF